MSSYVGLLCIGDPHLASRALGARKDDYPRVVLAKLRWALDYARRERLLPAMLGDVFNWPRDNANWLLAEVLALLQSETLTIYGNHDCAFSGKLTPDDSLQVLIESGRLTLISGDAPWSGRINGCQVAVAGSSWGTHLPYSWDATAHDWVVWLTHHDLEVPGYEESARLEPRALPGIDLVVNGHIHTPCPDVRRGATTWVTPGNIARVSRGKSHRARTPSVLRIDVGPDGLTRRAVEVPHQPYDEVFHPLPEHLEDEESPLLDSAFANRLRERLERGRTGGVGLMDFLEAHFKTDAFSDEVADEIRALAREVCND